MSAPPIISPRLARCQAAIRNEGRLRQLAAAGDAFRAGAVGLKAVSKHLAVLKAAGPLPDDLPVSPASLTELPGKLAAVTAAVFGGPRRLYRDPLHPGGPIPGLTAEGLELAALARELLAWLDA